jgi:pyridoxine kinase
VKIANPAARYCCDPVIGNAGRGVFVRHGIPEFVKERLVPVADIVTPNQFELEYLAGCATATTAELAAAIDAVHARGPRIVFVTSSHTSVTPSDCIDLMVSDGSDRCLLRIPRLPIVANGAGDVVAALFLAHVLTTGSPVEAMALAASSLFGVLNRTAEAGAREMLLVEAQEEFVNPSQVFAAQRI